MYIPLWLLLAGFTAGVYMVGVIIEHKEEKRKLEELTEELEEELEEKSKPVSRLSAGVSENYHDPTDGSGPAHLERR